MQSMSFIFLASLIFCLTLVIIEAAGVRLPARLFGCWDSGLLVRCAAIPFYFALASRIIWAASCGVWALLSTSCARVSRNALNSAFVIPLSISSLPFVSGAVVPLPYMLSIVYLYTDFNWHYKQICTQIVVYFSVYRL